MSHGVGRGSLADSIAGILDLMPKGLQLVFSKVVQPVVDAVWMPKQYNVEVQGITITQNTSNTVFTFTEDAIIRHIALINLAGTGSYTRLRIYQDSASVALEKNQTTATYFDVELETPFPVQKGWTIVVVESNVGSWWLS